MAIHLNAVTFYDGRFGPNKTADQNTALVKPNNETEPLIDGAGPIQSLTESVLQQRASVLEVMQGNDSLTRYSHPNREQMPKIPNGGEIVQSAASAMTALQTKPSGKFFSGINRKNQKKEYHRALFTMNDLITAGRKIATDCNYAKDIRVCLEKYNDEHDLAFACITFRERMDHAQKTPPAIQALEQQRSRVILDFIANCYEQVGVPKDPALQAIYRPTHEQRQALWGNHSKYTASTDCVMFIYRPVLNKNAGACPMESKGGKTPAASTSENT